MSEKNLTIATRVGYWAATARPLMIGPIDGYAIFPALFFMMHIRYWTLALLIFVITLSVILARFGYDLPVLWRMLLTSIGGRRVRRMPGIGMHQIYK